VCGYGSVGNRPQAFSFAFEMDCRTWNETVSEKGNAKAQKQKAGTETIKINNRSCRLQWGQLDGANWEMLSKVAHGELGIFQLKRDSFYLFS